MKSIIKALAFMLTVVLIYQYKKEHEPEAETAFSDINFLNALIDLGVDTNGDNINSPAEAEIITYLDVEGKNISDISGIELFINLISLQLH
jgi:hypothetical protein